MKKFCVRVILTISASLLISLCFTQESQDPNILHITSDGQCLVARQGGVEKKIFLFAPHVFETIPFMDEWSEDEKSLIENWEWLSSDLTASPQGYTADAEVENLLTQYIRTPDVDVRHIWYQQDAGYPEESTEPFRWGLFTYKLDDALIPQSSNLFVCAKKNPEDLPRPSLNRYKQYLSDQRGTGTDSVASGP